MSSSLLPQPRAGASPGANDDAVWAGIITDCDLYNIGF